MTQPSTETLAWNDLALEWHAGAFRVDMEAFRLWALAGLGSKLQFDGAVWGFASDSGSTHFRGTEPEILHGPHGEALVARAMNAPPNRVVRHDAEPHAQTVAAVDPASSGAAPSTAASHVDGQLLHARVHGLGSAISVRFADLQSGNSQFLLLRRGLETNAFDALEAAMFEFLAPHMMSSFSTCRKLHLVEGSVPGAPGSVRASAIVDRAGHVHESDARFVRTLRREWADWPGRRLPEALMTSKARKVASKWQFLGRQIVADFTPVNDLFLVVARPRLAADALTAREWDIARRYASGSEYRQVAEALQVAPATVRSHLRRVFSKLNVKNKAQLAASIA